MTAVPVPVPKAAMPDRPTAAGKRAFGQALDYIATADAPTPAAFMLGMPAAKANRLLTPRRWRRRRGATRSRRPIEMLQFIYEILGFS